MVRNRMFTKKLFFLILGLAPLVLITHSQVISKLNKENISFPTLDNKINMLMKTANVQGLAIAVFNNNEPVYKKVFGYKRIDTKELIKTTTNFYGASLSKAVFAVLVMKLVEDGVIDLDKPLQIH